MYGFSEHRYSVYNDGKACWRVLILAATQQRYFRRVIFFRDTQGQIVIAYCMMPYCESSLRYFVVLLLYVRGQGVVPFCEPLKPRKNIMTDAILPGLVVFANSIRYLSQCPSSKYPSHELSRDFWCCPQILATSYA